MKITASLFQAHFKCPTKCWLRFTGEVVTGNDYAEWLESQNESYRNAAIERLRAEVPEGDCAVAPAQESLKTSEWRLGFNVFATSQNLEACLHAVERVPSEGRGKSARFIPVRFVFTNKLGKDEKLLLAFDASVLSEILGREVNLGKIIHGDNHAALKVKTSSLTSEVRKRLDKIASLLSSTTPPDLVLNRHCGECEFQARCKQKAIEKDDLSLLSNMKEKERKKFNSEGIFTVIQLSYTFRPRRRPKRLRAKREKYHHALKALAIREKKIHIVGTPELKIDGTPVYLDVEGLPDRDFYYLIGLRFKTADTVVQHSFWVDDLKDERKAWNDFLDVLAAIERPVLIHYGSFETTFLKRMTERHGRPAEGSPAAKILAAAINILSVIFAQIYFPTHSNGLKDVGSWLGYKWSGVNASGAQSIIWRTEWQESGDPAAKQKLMTYNSEDCQALQIVTEALARLCSPDHRPDLDKRIDPAAVLAESPDTKDTLFRRFTTSIEDFKVISKAARWDFQRDRVYVRTDKMLKRTAFKKNARAKLEKSRVKRTLPINKKVNCAPLQTCPFCGRRPDREFRPRSLILYDLLFSKFGLKRWVVKYRFHYCWCGFCQKRLGKPNAFWPRSDFGRNAVAFVIYEIIELCVPQMTTAQNINRLFGLKIGNSTVNAFKASAAEYYAETRRGILKRMVEGNLMHADETTIALKDRGGYVWVFASLHAVVYFYADTREGDLLQEKLKGFEGVLVSDFYAAYDSLACPQQKCLLHLMRDLNQAVLDAPFDEEVKQIALGFGDLLKNIVGTIDRWGLKRRFLNRHLAGVDRFYRQIEKTDYQSAAALKCKDRFERNRQKLFTFLNHDGIPWNNNNAEHAIKAFARLRRAIGGLSSPKGIDDYLVLFSICQTCKYSGLDFLDFVLSGEKDIDLYAQNHARGKRPTHIYHF
jgi:predicted RecB family nuclease